jgi:poly-gamma-glutamate synthesis protein (capsule biosynthesis protein)
MRNFLFFIFTTGCIVSGSPRNGEVLSGTVPLSDTVPLVDSIKLIFAGDVMGHGMQIKGAWRDGGDSCYDYRPVFQHAKKYISTADIAIANLEVTLAGEPYAGYPRFSSHDALATALQEAGFHVLLTANNHCVDRGKQGLERTVNVLDSLGIYRTGTFKDSTDRKNSYPLMIEKNAFRLAILNCTYGTNGLPVEQPNIVNMIDTVQIAEDIAKARKLQADYIIACIHWGDEYKNRENRTQRNIAAFLARNGCSLIIGAHPHVVQPFGLIPDGNGDSIPVIYSLGNFVSNQRERYRNGGIALEVNLTKADSTVRMQSCSYEPFWVHRFLRDKVSVFRLIPVNSYLNDPSEYTVGEEDKKLMMQFYNDTKALLPGLPHRISN